MNILSLLHEDMREYLISAFSLPQNDKTIVRGYNNLNPIPKQAIIMTFRTNGHIDQMSREYDGENLVIFNSVRGTMQLDFYGEGSFDKAQEISTLWNTIYTTELLENCVPLRTPAVRDLSFVNEAGKYEYRFLLDLELQYNTNYQKTVKILEDASQTNVELNNV